MPITEDFDPLAEYAKLLDDFPRLYRAAQVLELPPDQDAAVVRLAIIGYSFHCNTGTWTDADSAAVKDYRTHMPTAAFSQAWISFSCLAWGFTLGLRRSARLNDLAALHAESLLPGFMMRNRSKLEGFYLVGQLTA